MFDEVHVVVVKPLAVTTPLTASMNAPEVSGVIAGGVGVVVVEMALVAATSWSVVPSTPE